MYNTAPPPSSPPLGLPSPYLERLKELMRGPKCQARPHLGKGGLYSPIHDGYWTDMDAYHYMKDLYNCTWPKFEKIVKELDPKGKFSDPRNIFSGS